MSVIGDQEAEKQLTDATDGEIEVQEHEPTEQENSFEDVSRKEFVAENSNITDVDISYVMETTEKDETEAISEDVPKLGTTSKLEKVSVRTLSWDHRVNLLAEKVLDPMIHCCDICLRPILIYGRVIPCKHIFCLNCAKKESKMCPRCKQRIARVEQTALGTIFMCIFGGTKYGSAGCRRTYLSQRDLQAHINHRHSESSKSPKDAVPKSDKPATKESPPARRTPSSGGSDSRYQNDQRPATKALTPIRTESLTSTAVSPRQQQRQQYQQQSPPTQQRTPPLQQQRHHQQQSPPSQRHHQQQSPPPPLQQQHQEPIHTKQQLPQTSQTSTQQVPAEFINKPELLPPPDFSQFSRAPPDVSPVQGPVVCPPGFISPVNAMISSVPIVTCNQNAYMQPSSVPLPPPPFVPSVPPPVPFSQSQQPQHFSLPLTVSIPPPPLPPPFTQQSWNTKQNQYY